MAIRTFGPANGDWCSASSWVEGVVPTKDDDVVFNALSGKVYSSKWTYPDYPECHNLSFAAYTQTALAQYSNLIINIYGNYVGGNFLRYASVSLNFYNTEDITITWNCSFTTLACNLYFYGSGDVDILDTIKSPIRQFYTAPFAYPLTPKYPITSIKVLGIRTTPPEAPTEGDMYLLLEKGEGSWAKCPSQTVVIYYDFGGPIGLNWGFYQINTTWIVTDQDTGKLYIYNPATCSFTESAMREIRFNNFPITIYNFQHNAGIVSCGSAIVTIQGNSTSASTPLLSFSQDAILRADTSTFIFIINNYGTASQTRYLQATNAENIQHLKLYNVIFKLNSLWSTYGNVTFKSNIGFTCQQLTIQKSSTTFYSTLLWNIQFLYLTKVANLTITGVNIDGNNKVLIAGDCLECSNVYGSYTCESATITNLNVYNNTGVLKTNAIATNCIGWDLDENIPDNYLISNTNNLSLEDLEKFNQITKVNIAQINGLNITDITTKIIFDTPKL